MAIIAGTYDFTVQRRSDHTESISLTDGNDNPVNLTGFQIASQVYDESRTTLFASFTVDITSASNGTFTLTLSRSQTESFTLNELKYDVKLKSPSDKQEYYIEGTIFVSEGYTVFT
tara:strand:+ start:107 stop:454 length:348 start_codon:yes stop_codon:yes gene_type:complete